MTTDIMQRVIERRRVHDAAIASFDDLFGPRQRIHVGFSGGETSARLAILAKRAWGKSHDLRFIFANTTLENEETYRFIRDVSLIYDIPVTWLEMTPKPLGEGVGYRIVNYDTAARDGSAFEAMIQKHGIPNRVFPKCSDELKTRVVQTYLRDLGWKHGSYKTLIGIRADEIHRVGSSPNVLYPLVRHWPNTKPTINAFWSRQPTRLQLKGYQGNCKSCWKKSLRKHLTIMSETPEAYSFFERMELTYPHVGPEQRKAVYRGADTAPPRRFFRENMTVQDIRDLAAKGDFTPADDDSIVYDHRLDGGAECGESCEVNFE